MTSRHGSNASRRSMSMTSSSSSRKKKTNENGQQQSDSGKKSVTGSVYVFSFEFDSCYLFVCYYACWLINYTN